MTPWNRRFEREQDGSGNGSAQEGMCGSLKGGRLAALFSFTEPGVLSVCSPSQHLPGKTPNLLPPP